MISLRSIDKSDKQFFIASVLIPLGVWWWFTGRSKYGVGGMK